VSLLAGTHRRTAIDQIDTLAEKSRCGTRCNDTLANRTPRRMVDAMRVRRWAASLAVAVALAGNSASAASAAPPPVLPHPPPIAATFQLHPDSGPVGTQVTIKGACGFPATLLLFGINVQTADGTQTIWLPTEFTTLKPNPIGVFSVTFTFPSLSNVPVEFGGWGTVPIPPGTYYVGAGCASPEVVMGLQPFTATA
jgi:hypothetical protein